MIANNIAISLGLKYNGLYGIKINKNVYFDMVNENNPPIWIYTTFDNLYNPIVITTLTLVDYSICEIKTCILYVIDYINNGGSADGITLDDFKSNIRYQKILELNNGSK